VALRAVRLPGEWLELEVTESILARDAHGAQQRRHALAEIGVRLAIDDFGTGYSGLGYAKNLPVSRLKIGRSLVGDLPGAASCTWRAATTSGACRSLRRCRPRRSRICWSGAPLSSPPEPVLKQPAALYSRVMTAMDSLLDRKLAALNVPVAVVLPGGRRVGPDPAPVTLRLAELGPLAHLATGKIGKLGADYVEGRLDIDGRLRDLMAVAGQLMRSDPVEAGSAPAPLGWWRAVWQEAKSRARHRPGADARQVEHHYDVSDDFYALWLDPRRVYSCAYYESPGATLAQAQEAKLDHICRKLRLRPGERFLDVGAGWGGLLLWAAERYGVRAQGITLSRNQHAHVNRQIAERGLEGRVVMELRDYRALPEDEPFDKIASVGMFEHVGRARLPEYFAKMRRLLRPGGLLLNHGITAAGTRNAQLGAGLGDFIERYIFPGGELLHVSHVMRVLAEAGLEPLDTESLRPHYARTLWAWSDALEAHLTRAREVTSERVVRAYRLYLAGCAMAFEQSWISLFQLLVSRPSGHVGDGEMRGAQSAYPFHRGYMYGAAPR
jgi:cyclopropane-fatty-acyl-phospholipid synthase